jgi:hypothetical protein
MGDLEQVHAGQARRHQLRVDRFLDVAHQQEPPVADLALEDDRHVVDGRASIRRLDRDTSRQGPESTHRDLVDNEAIARRDPGPHRSVAISQLAQPCGISGTRAAHPWLEHAIDVVSREQQGEPGHVVLVRVRQDHRVNPAVPRWNASVECDHQAVRIGAPVDQQAATTRTLDQDRVTLADVEDRDPRGPTRPSQRHAANDDDRDDERGGQGPVQGVGTAGSLAGGRADRLAYRGSSGSEELARRHDWRSTSPPDETGNPSHRQPGRGDIERWRQGDARKGQ